MLLCREKENPSYYDGSDSFSNNKKNANDQHSGNPSYRELFHQYSFDSAKTGTGPHVGSDFQQSSSSSESGLSEVDISFEGSDIDAESIHTHIVD
mmetsp:Transcript_13690/g.16592  ORF Transcript_13690/g.16592 Transcript_13690/m.16592 type:complete len:95 (-) Transcript_13690:73-357(-)